MCCVQYICISHKTPLSSNPGRTRACLLIPQHPVVLAMHNTLVLLGLPWAGQERVSSLPRHPVVLAMHNTLVLLGQHLYCKHTDAAWKINNLMTLASLAAVAENQ